MFILIKGSAVYYTDELVQGTNEVFTDEYDLLDLSLYETTDLGDGVMQLGALL